MTHISRRMFLKQTLAGPPALIAGTSALLAGTSALLTGCATTPPPMPRASDLVALGRCGITVPRVAMGTGTHGWKKASDQTRLGKEGFAGLMAHGVARGSAFIDAADLYGSHEFVKHTLKNTSVRRDQVTILSKVWFAEAPEMTPTTTARPEVERFLREMGVESIDICLIHCVQAPDWTDSLKRIRDDLSELKQKGMVRAVGCSGHTLAAMKTAAAHPWIDVILARINPEHRRMDPKATTDEVAAVLKQARLDGKGVIGMKIYGCGDLATPERRLASLKYVLDNNLVDAMTIGFTAPEQIDDTMNAVDSILKARAMPLAS